MRRSPDPSILAVGNLAFNLRSAVETLQAVAARIDDTVPLAAEVEREAGELTDYLHELESRGDEGRSAPFAWALDGGWRATAMAVAATRPRVLMTVASNAVAALVSAFDHALEERWDGDLEALLEEQRSGLSLMQSRLIDARYRHLAPSPS
jgi:hypothetical protein